MLLFRLPCAVLLLIVLIPPAIAQNIESPDSLDAPRTLLWPNGAPGVKGESLADKPALFLYPASPERATGAGVVICPGGGYSSLATGHEGRAVAEWLNEYGISAFVLRYRHGPRYQHPWPLRDAQRAVRMVRAHAEAWRVDPDRVGVLGFSAGGHLASTVATHIEPPDSSASDSLERFTTRPDFLTLIYPVISFVEPFTHTGSRRMLLGADPDSSVMRRLSSEKQVSDRTPPTFLVHAGEDEVVPAENSLAFYRALQDADVPAEMHLYEEGHHGFGLAPTDPVLSTWTDRWVDWARERGLLGGGPWR
ncbi:MAG: alpha/beta hydrolase [Salinibacter sp.]